MTFGNITAMKKIISLVITTILVGPWIVIAILYAVEICSYLRSGYELEKIPRVQEIAIFLRNCLVIVLLILAVIIFVRTYRVTSFLFKRIVFYVKLFIVSIRRKHKISLKRFPFASLLGLRAKEDILIKNKEKTFCIHFIDVIGRARVFSLVNENEYNIARTTPDAPKSLGAAYFGGASGAKLAAVMSSTISSGKTIKFPKFDTNVGEHIVILDPLPMEVRYIDNGVPKPLFSGYNIGDITYYESKDFIKLLKRI